MARREGYWAERRAANPILIDREVARHRARADLTRKYPDEYKRLVAEHMEAMRLRREELNSDPT